MENYKILICGSVHQRGIDLLESKPGFQVELCPSISDEELSAKIGDIDALIVKDEINIDAKILRKAENLKIIGKAGVSLANIDVNEATRRGVVVMNTPGVNAVATAEHTISMIMAAHRHIAQAVSSMKAGLWEKKKFQGREMAGKLLGVIGLGRIGGMVARMASRGLKMDVVGYDPALTARAASQLGIRLGSLDEVVSQSETITIHVPLNNSTRGLLGPDQFKSMRRGVIIVNCAQGGIIDEDALYDALEQGIVSTAALDVLEVFPPTNTKLINHKNVIMTPRLSAATQEAQIGTSVAVIEQIVDFLGKGVIRNAINVSSLDDSTKRKIGPYLDLAKRLGSFLGQYTPAGVTEMEIEYSDDISSDLQPITNAALVGLLSTVEGADVNLVNAAAIAGERGIQVSETILKEAAAFGPSLELRTKTKEGAVYSLQGALIRRIGFEPRIIGIGPFVTEAVPAGPMLIVRNKDVPGMIAGMSSTLAQSGINIAQMNLSRDCIGGSAMSIINIDTPADDTTLQKIRGIEGILSVDQIIIDA